MRELSARVFPTGLAVKLCVLFLCACSASKPQPRTPGISAISFEEPLGLSDLSLAPDKTLWSVAEDGQSLVQLDLQRQHVQSFPIQGVPRGLDLEALAWLDADTVAIGTEGEEDERSRDKILIATKSKQGFVIAAEYEFSYKPWKLNAEKNKGVEAVCAVDGFILAGSEQRAKDVAPLALYTRDGNIKSYAKLHLSSSSGKLSALACKLRGDAIELYAIERHFEVSRLLHAYLPLSGGDVVPEVVLDLYREIQDVPNLEGLAWQGDQFWLLSDNQYGTRQGPTWLFVVSNLQTTETERSHEQPKQ